LPAGIHQPAFETAFAPALFVDSAEVLPLPVSLKSQCPILWCCRTAHHSDRAAVEFALLLRTAKPLTLRESTRLRSPRSRSLDGAQAFRKQVATCRGLSAASAHTRQVQRPAHLEAPLMASASALAEIPRQRQVKAARGWGSNLNRRCDPYPETRASGR
jgi:hypothetical protein